MPWKNVWILHWITSLLRTTNKFRTAQPSRKQHLNVIWTNFHFWNYPIVTIYHLFAKTSVKQNTVMKIPYLQHIPHRFIENYLESTQPLTFFKIRIPWRPVSTNSSIIQLLHCKTRNISKIYWFQMLMWDLTHLTAICLLLDWLTL